MKNAEQAIREADYGDAGERNAFAYGVQLGRDAEREGRKHCGYTNYETFAVILWIDSSEDSQSTWREKGKKVEGTELADKACNLAGTLKEAFEVGAERCRLRGLYADLLNAGLSEVNWYEVAMSILNE